MRAKHGIRIQFKRDKESSIGRGAVIYRAHFRPEMACILYYAAYHAPKELDEMWVTEGWRSIRDSRDLHRELRAFDVDCTRINAPNANMRYNLASEWARKVGADLGPDYQVVLHGGEASLHLHIELDP